MQIKFIFPSVLLRPRNMLIMVTLLLASTILAAPVSVRFDGDSTLHTFSGNVESNSIEINPDGGGRGTVSVSIQVLQMKTGHDGRDENMYKMFDAEKFPLIRGTASLDDLVDATRNVVPIALTICDQTRTVEARRESHSKTGDGKIQLSWTISLKLFNLKAPTVMGIIRVYDEVNVICDFDIAALKKSGDAPVLEPN